MRVVRETDVGGAGDGSQNWRAEQREAARPPAGIPVPALAEDVIQRRTSKSTVTCRHHDTSDRPPRALMVMEVPTCRALRPRPVVLGGTGPQVVPACADLRRR